MSENKRKKRNNAKVPANRDAGSPKDTAEDNSSPEAGTSNAAADRKEIPKDILDELQAFDWPVPDRDLPSTLSERRVLNPGLADIQLAEVTQLGHRDRFPRSCDWINLLPVLGTEEELLWIVQKRERKHHFFLGLKCVEPAIQTRDAVAQRRKRFAMICDGFARRCFPESRLELVSTSETPRILAGMAPSASGSTFCVTGVPSSKTLDQDSLFEKREEDARTDASLNDVLEALTEEDGFTLVFTLARATLTSVRERFHAKSLIRDEIAPLARQEVNSSHTRSSDRNWSKTAGSNKGKSYQEARWLLPKIMQLLFGSSGLREEKSKWWRGVLPNKQSGTNRSRTAGGSEGEQDSSSVSVTHVRTYLDFMDKALELSMRHLQQAGGTGGYFGSVMVNAKNEAGARRLFQCLSATLSGSHSFVRPMQAVPVLGVEPPLFHLARGAFVHEMIPTVEILTVEQAGRWLLVPEVEIPGVQLKRSVFYGRPQLPEDKEQGVSVGEVAFHKPILVSKPARVEGERPARLGEEFLRQYDFHVPRADLCSHTLLVGTTGSGKTERAVSILNNLNAGDFRVIVIETAKKTYRNRLRRDHDPLVYTLGVSTERPFRINPFCFDEGTSLKRHISVLADAIAELLPMEALIGPKLREAIEKSYSRLGWDIETGRFTEGTPRFPDMVTFNDEVYRICGTVQDYGPEVRANYKGALLNRARIFMDDVYQDVFAFDGNKSFDELFPRDTILEMEELPPSEINMPGFILSLVLERLRAHQFRKIRAGGHVQKILLVIEEAHNLLHRKFEQQVDERQAGRGRRLIEQVVRLLQEGRALNIGVMVVDQSAQYLADAVIANTNTKIVHRQEDGKEIEVIGTAIGLPEEDRDDLQRLADGECVLKTKRQSAPVKLAPLPEERLSKERDWQPFDDTMWRADYYGVLKEFGKFSAREVSWGEADDIAKALLDRCAGHMDLTRFAAGKFAAELGRYDLVGLAARIQTPADLQNLVLALQPPASPAKSVFYTLLFMGLGWLTYEQQELLRLLTPKVGNSDDTGLQKEAKALCERLLKAGGRMIDGESDQERETKALWIAQFCQALNEWVAGLKAAGPDMASKLESIRWFAQGNLFHHHAAPLLWADYCHIMGCSYREVRQRMLENNRQAEND